MSAHVNHCDKILRYSQRPWLGWLGAPSCQLTSSRLEKSLPNSRLPSAEWASESFLASAVSFIRGAVLEGDSTRGQTLLRKV